MAKLVRTIAANGANQVYWWCIPGDHRISKQSLLIAHDLLRQSAIDPNNLPVQDNYSGTEPCAVCGDPFTELHHWSPRYLFADADIWPTSYLCSEHHHQWHNIVTPDMSKKRDK